MKTMDANTLLQAYARERSEPAFQELVNRYVDLVFSTALRRVSGNRHLAEDVAQQVFSDLARKAASLPNDVMLGGWLHRHTGFVASNLMRSEQRRQARERKALEMNALNESSDDNWNQVAPVLDEAMDQLDSSDRDALVLRFFERRELRAVGTALGISDDAAQKRVSRAVERLRELLVNRGSTILPVAALSLLLGTHTVQAAPAGLASRFGKIALSAATGSLGGGIAATIANAISPATAKLALASAAIAMAAVLLVHLNGSTAQKPQTSAERPLSKQGGITPPTTNVDLGAAAQPQVAAKTSAPVATNGIHLTILAADSGKPVPNVLVESRGNLKKKYQVQNFFGDRAGNCYINIPREEISDLQLTTRIDGFADTRLQWLPDYGQEIPASYTLRLVRPIPIGGTVVNPDGQPVAGAKVGFNHEDDPTSLTLPENHEFSWIEVETDANGHWNINRIAPEMIHRIYGSAKHPEYVQSAMTFAASEKEAEQQLRSGNFVFRLGRAATVRGVVLDPDGAAIAGANILVGKRSMSDSRQEKSGPDGTFEIRGCRMGTNYLTAEASEFSATTMEVVLNEDSAPFKLMLQRGKMLRMRVLGQAGEPIVGAYVWLDTMHHRPLNAPDYGVTPIQASLDKKTDENGLMIWSNAPDADLDFDISASGYMRKNQVKIRPDGEEHLITLSSALTISCTVRDADTGEPIPRFKIITGWPQTNWIPDPDNPGETITKVEGRWGTIDRYWVTYWGGKYKHALEEPALYSDSNPGYVLKIEADDYAPFISRAIAAAEGNVQLDVSMHRSTARQISVVFPDGTPAANTDIGLVGPGSHLKLMPDGFSRQTADAGTTLLRTDSDGRFRFPGDPAITHLIAVNASGYTEMTATALAENSTLVLQPWGRLEGTYLSSGLPATNRNLLLQFTDNDELGGVGFDFTAFKVSTDSQGRFVFPHTPPGNLKIIYLAHMPPNGFMHRPLPDGDVEIHSGETTTKSIGSSGYTVKARVRWPEEIPPDRKWHFFASAASAPPQALLQSMNDPAALAELRKSPEMRAYAKKARNFPAEVADDYSITIENVPPGEFVVTVMAFRETSGEQEMKDTVSGYSSVLTIPTDPAFGTLDAGEILLRRPSLAKNK